MAQSTIDSLITELAKILYPLRSVSSSPEQAEALLNALGWDLPPSVNDIGLTGLNVQPLVDKLLVVLNSTPADQEDELLMASRYADLLLAVANLIQDIRSMMSAISTLAGVSNYYLNKTKIHEHLLTRLLDFLIIKYVEQNHYSLHTSLQLVGVFELKQLPVNPSIFQVEHLRHKIVYDRIGTVLSDAGSLPADVYGWGTANPDIETLLINLARFLQSFGGEVGLYNLRRKAEEQLLGRSVPEAETDPMPQIYISLLKGLGWDELDVGLTAFGLRPSAPGGTDGGLGITPYAKGATELVFPLSSDWSFEIDSTLDVQGGVALLLRPNQPIEVRSDLHGAGIGTTVATGCILVKLCYGGENTEPFTIISIPGGSYLEADKVYVGGGAGMVSTDKFDVFVEGGLKGARFVFDPSKGDSFIAKIIPAEGFKVDFDLGVGWSRVEGLYFQGSAALEIKLPVHFSLGPIEINGIYVRIPIGSNDCIPLELSSSITAQLGPLTAVVDRLGLTAKFSFPKSGDGNLGPVNLDLDFKPPNGIGLTIDGQGFKGGGFLLFDHDNQRYAGALELEFQNTISLKAIGLVTTKLPGGEKGFSLLIIISAEFTPIQLGYGFTLNGVGGLLGLNRTMKVQRLLTGIKDNTLKSILFPTNIIANADRIISDLRQVFPPEQDRFVFGPMAKIGWGTPTLITIELGVIIEVPNPIRIALLGVLKALLPDEKLRLLRIQVNFLGVLDFQKQRLAFDASLYDSTLLRYTLSGDMALRLLWGNNPNFLLTVGGFHPAYNPPPVGLMNLVRLTLNLLGGKNPRLTLETYFAVTSNTVQFGAKIELYAAAWKFNVYGFLSFDVLFQFSPFYFIASIRAMLAVRIGSTSLFSVGLSLTLAGPTPWKAKGTAKFKICWFITVKVRFSKTFGESRDTCLPDIKVMPLLQSAIKNKGNWQAHIPPHSHLQVSIREIDDTGKTIIVPPFGILTVSQKVVPLNLKIDKFGNQKPKDTNQFRINEVRSNGDVLATTDVEEFFAPAQFFDMEDAQRLSRKSFEKYPSGVRIAASEKLNSDHYTKKDVEYELTYIDTRLVLVFRGEKYTPRLLAFAALLNGNAIAKSDLAFAKKAKSPLAPKEVTVKQERFAVVGTSDLKLFAGTELASSEAKAYNTMSELIANDSDLADKIQVVPQYEVNMT